MSPRQNPSLLLTCWLCWCAQWHIWIRVPAQLCDCPAGFRGATCDVATDMLPCPCEPGHVQIGTPPNAAACQECGAGTYAPRGAADSSCEQWACEVGTTDHDADPRTPCLACASARGAPTRGSIAPCCDCENGGTCPNNDGVCACPAGTIGRYCEATDPLWQSSCASGYSDEEYNGECVRCPAGTYAPAGSVGPCALLRCPNGTSDVDLDSSSPCQPCEAAQGSTIEGWFGPCPVSQQCYNGGVARSPSAAPRSCSDLARFGSYDSTNNGQHTVWPQGPSGGSVRVVCEFSNGRGWTLVSASKSVTPTWTSVSTPPTSTEASTTGAGVFDGLLPAVWRAGGLADVRLSCTGANMDAMAQDVALLNVDLYSRVLSGGDAAAGTYQVLRGAPAKVNLATGVEEAACLESAGNAAVLDTDVVQAVFGGAVLWAEPNVCPYSGGVSNPHFNVSPCTWRLCRRLLSCCA